MHLENILDILSPNDMQRYQLCPLCVLNVVRYDEGVSRCMLQKSSLASSFENTVAQFNLWEISSKVGAL